MDEQLLYAKLFLDIWYRPTSILNFNFFSYIVNSFSRFTFVNTREIISRCVRTYNNDEYSILFMKIVGDSSKLKFSKYSRY